MIATPGDARKELDPALAVAQRVGRGTAFRASKPLPCSTSLPTLSVKSVPSYAFDRGGPPLLSRGPKHSGRNSSDSSIMIISSVGSRGAIALLLPQSNDMT